MTADEKNRLKEYQKNYRATKNINNNFLYNIKMVEKTLNFDEVKINKRNFPASK